MHGTDDGHSAGDALLDAAQGLAPERSGGEEGDAAARLRQGHAPSFPRTAAAETPRMRNDLPRLVCPDSSSIRCRLTPRSSASSSTRAAFALPWSAGACTAIFRASPCTPTTPLRFAPG